jgi:dihydrofolate synthase/folylpolyglutamate synthase
MLLVDGAHNVASIRRLVSNIRAYFGGRRIILVFGTSCDKDIPGIVGELAGLSSEVVVTQASHSRAARSSTLAAEFRRRGIEPEQSESTRQGLERALSRAAGEDLICVTGSLFVVAEALDYLSAN